MFDKKLTRADLDLHKTEIEQRLVESARNLGALVRKTVDDLSDKLDAKNRSRQVLDDRLVLIARDTALDRAMKTPGISGHAEVLEAARAYEQFLNSEPPSPAH